MAHHVHSLDDAGQPLDDREAARRRLRARRDLGTNVVAFVVINAVLVGIWAMSGAGYFWPGWIIGLWGAGLLLHGWDTFGRKPITEADIDAEVKRRGRRES